jgi:hypothetical protein
MIGVEPGHGVREELAESLEGYPVNVVGRRIVALGETRPGPFPLGAGDDGWDAWTYDPLVGGISISPCVDSKGSLRFGERCSALPWTRPSRCKPAATSTGRSSISG